MLYDAWQSRVAEKDCSKISIARPFGMFEFACIWSEKQTFQKFMNNFLQDMLYAQRDIDPFVHPPPYIWFAFFILLKYPCLEIGRIKVNKFK